MSALVRAYDWSATPLGAVGQWPQSLKTAVDIVLASPLPAIALCGPDLIQIYNDGYAVIAGAKHPQALGQPTRDCWPETWTFNAPIYEAVFRGEARSFAGQKLTLQRHGGEPEDAWFDLAFSPLRNEAGAVSGVLVTVVETTDRVQAEAAREKAERAYRDIAGLAGLSADFRALFEASPTPFLVLAPDFSIVAANEAYLRATLTRRDEIAGRPLFEVFPDNPDDPDATGVRNLRASLERVLATRRPDTMAVQKYDIQRPASTGGGFEERWWSPLNTPVLGSDGAVACIIHRVEDVTELVRLRSDGAAQDQLARDQQAAIERSRDAYRALTESEARLGEERTRLMTLVDNLPIGVCFFDREGRPLLSNPVFRRFLPGELIPSRSADGEERWMAWDEDGRRLPLDRYPAARALLGETVHGVEFLHRPENGADVWTRVSSIPLRNAEGQVVAAIVVIADIDEQKRAQQALRRLNETLERRVAEALAERQLWVRVFESTDAIIVVLDSGYRVLAANAAWQNEFEAIYGVRPRAGDNVLDLLADQPEQQAGARAVWDRALAGEEFTIVDEFGDPARRRPCYELKFNVLNDRDGRQIGAFLYAHDVTERLREQARLAEAEGQLRQAQKMEAVGQLTGGVAHDFNNLLTGVLGNLELLDARLHDERLRKLVDAATRSARRGAMLTEQLLAFSRRQHLAPKPTDLNAVVGGMSDMLRRTLGGTVVVQTALAADLWPALVDVTQIEVAILNLAINARDAMPLGGKVQLGTRNVPASDRRDRPEDLPSGGDYVALSVADTGEGMSAEVLDRAFEPFFTTKELGKGTGLGLSQVYGLARQSGGTARIRSRQGGGTTVELYLPRAGGELGAGAGGPAASVVADAQAGRRGTVLVVDDQDEVRDVVLAHLEALGYRTVPAANGRLALDLLSESGGGIDALLVDHAMPGLSGLEVIRAAREARRSLPVVLMTGYVDADALGKRVDGVVLLKKPFRRQELAAALDAAPQFTAAAAADGKR